MTRERVPCWRCAGEAKSGEAVCPTCNGWGSVVPGAPEPGARKAIKAFVRSEWWKKLRVAKAAGKKRGKKKERDRLIEKQTKDLWEMFQKMPAREQAIHLEFIKRTTVANNATLPVPGRGRETKVST